MSDDRVQPPDVKAGIKTSEFWLTLLGTIVSVVGQAGGAIPEPWGTIASAVLVAVYSIARALTKR